MCRSFSILPQISSAHVFDVWPAEAELYPEDCLECVPAVQSQHQLMVDDVRDVVGETLVSNWDFQRCSHEQLFPQAVQSRWALTLKVCTDTCHDIECNLVRVRTKHLDEVDRHDIQGTTV